MRRQSEESIRTEDCDGPTQGALMEDQGLQEEDGSNEDGLEKAQCSDRADLIERIKRGESPTWVPNEALKQEYLRNNNQDTIGAHRRGAEPQIISPLLPAAELEAVARLVSHSSQDQLDEQRQIQRPRSALHAGDFAATSTKDAQSRQSSSYRSRYPANNFEDGPLGTSPTTPWYPPPSSTRIFGRNADLSPQQETRTSLDRRPWRSRAPSLSSYSSSSFVLKEPTTPLVQQSNNTDLDFSPRERSISPVKSSRRRTLPPHAFHNIHSSSQVSPTPQSAHHSPSYPRESGFLRGHHPRRSLTSNWSLQASTSPHTPPYLRSRRTSCTSDTSPLQHAHMVGSYEESILRGWMSTAPSRPLDFTAQIGVLGRGKCKPKCPAHVTVPFPAVYYSWGSGTVRGADNDDPSPYVGHIDLQHSLKPAEPKEVPVSDVETSIEPHIFNEGPNRNDTVTKAEQPISKKRRRTSPSSAPLCGSYRIPQQGQLQIVIKNPNKTAVKLFLVPYDLEGMEPGSKTFVRQKSYSAELVTDRPQSSIPFAGLPTQKPTLRYLIDLKICSTSQGRFYLYQQIRVVFANRVPDDKEPLRNEIQLPQPRYSAYKPKSDSLSRLGSSAGARLTAEKAYRRRSSGLGMAIDEVASRLTQTFGDGTAFALDNSPVPAMPSIPYSLTLSRQKPVGKVRDDNDFNAMELDSSRPTTSDDTQSPSSETTHGLTGAQLLGSHMGNSIHGSDGYNKLAKGESGYGGVFGRPGTPELGEGLLARRLKAFEIQRDFETPGD